MCGIGILPRSEVRETILNQSDRGLDSLGIMTPTRNYWSMRTTYKGYKRYLKDKIPIDIDGLVILHHRKASVGAVSLSNSHPFIGETFTLLQNGTSKNFFKKYKNYTYGAETDSETLLGYLESKTSSIYEVPEVLDDLAKETKDKFGVIIIKQANLVLVYCDGSRETNINLNEDLTKVVRITNYVPDKSYGYENKGFILFKINGDIVENNFSNINKTAFVSARDRRSAEEALRTKEHAKRPVHRTPTYNTNNTIKAVGVGYDAWTTGATFDNVHGWTKVHAEFSEEDQAEYADASEFFYTNMVHFRYATHQYGIKAYLIFTYGVDTIEAYHRKYKGALPYHGIKRAFLDLEAIT